MAIKGQVSPGDKDKHESSTRRPLHHTWWHVCVFLLFSPTQICKEINKAANILADFIQDTAGVCDCVCKKYSAVQKF